MLIFKKIISIFSNPTKDKICKNNIETKTEREKVAEEAMTKITTKPTKKRKKRKSTPKRVGINMTPEEIEIANKIKKEICQLYKQEGYSIRMITSYYNTLYGTNGSDIISRETIRNIINKKDVSLKQVIKTINHF